MLYLQNTADLSKHRIEILDGQEHLVVPTVAAVQGVLNGQLLPISSLEASLPAWEGVAVTMSHPKKFGEDISANTKYALENFVVGRFFNANIDNNKFKGEFWINLEKLNNHEDGERFLEMVDNDETVEVSTAYWCKSNGETGSFKGRAYNGKQIDLVPNHIAILLHEEGACSVEDGCGAPRVNQQEEEEVVNKNCEEDRKKNVLNKLKDKFGSIMIDAFSGLMQNRISHDQLRRNLMEEISENERSDSFVFIIDVFDDEVIYGRELPNGEVDLFSRNYSVGSDPDYQVDLQEAVEVTQVVSYQPVSNSQEKEERHMDRDTLIERLATNEATPFTREQLTDMNDDQLQHLASTLETNDEAPNEEPGTESNQPAEGEGEIEEEQEEPKAAPATNSSALNPDVLKALNALGADGIVQVTNAAKELADKRAKEKDALVSKLIANERVTMQEQTLRRMDLEALQGVARMANISVNYAGNGGPVSEGHGQENNGPPPSPNLILSDPNSE